MLNREQVRDAMLICNAFVLPSLYETFGIVLIEALSCGKPVIATRCGGPEWILNEQNGFLVTKGDESYLANAMQRMVKNYHLFCPKLIREDCVGRFSEHVVVAQLERTYASVLKCKDR
jgi:glycosyltransferase involved in cell wall biosynthesis